MHCEAEEDGEAFDTGKSLRAMTAPAGSCGDSTRRRLRDAREGVPLLYTYDPALGEWERREGVMPGIFLI